MTTSHPSDWKTLLADKLPLLGHRNWIAVVDSAYPWQTAPGLQTVVTGEDQLVVVEAVLDAISQSPHVQPVLFIDSELAMVDPAHAPGVAEYRLALSKILAGHTFREMLHEGIIAQLDEAGRTFHVLVLKTNLVIPYTSVFIRLDCGYWTPEAEAALRARIAV
jgi:hypothetical protein